jgi:exosortase A-associated hydrolase 1
VRQALSRITPFAETPVNFQCRGENLFGIVHHGGKFTEVGALVVVGGPQYRVGSHRQFVLLARYLAARGIPVMRFDVRGMGDSRGEPCAFDDIDDDIGAAIDCFLQSCPSLQRVILWGLCDAASASLFYGYQDPRVQGMVLLNPWVFSRQGAAKAVLKHYYLQRLSSKDFWAKVLSLKFDYRASLASFAGLLHLAARRVERGEARPVSVKVAVDLPLPLRMRLCLERFTFPVLLILSGRDLTADEFRDAVNADPQWQALLAAPRLTRRDFVEADHTFSSAVWRDQVAEWTANWIQSL